MGGVTPPLPILNPAGGVTPPLPILNPVGEVTSPLPILNPAGEVTPPLPIPAPTNPQSPIPTMPEHYDRLGLSPGATPAEVKAAYHAKLKEFPAHTYPEDFKAIRAAYEVLRKGSKPEADFFAVVPIQATLDPALIDALRQRAMAAVDVTLEDLIRLTF